MKENNKSHSTVAEICYLLFFTVMFGIRALGFYEGHIVYNVAIVIGLVLFLLKIALTRHTIQEYIMIAAFMLLSVIVYWHSGEKGLLFYCAMMLGMKGVRSSRVFRTGVAVLLPCMLILSFLTSNGILSDTKVMFTSFAPFGEVLRRSLGYPYPNTTQITVLILCMMILYLAGLKRERTAQKGRYRAVVLMMVALSLYILMFTGSRTGFLAFLIYLLLEFYYWHHRHLNRADRIILQSVYPLTAVYSILVPLLVHVDPQSVGNSMESRWLTAWVYLQNNPVTLFGQRLNAPDWVIYDIDMAGMYLLLNLGVVAFVVISLIWIGLMHDFIQKGQTHRIAIAVAIFIAGMTEPFLYNLSFKNLLFIFAGEWLYERCALAEEKIAGRYHLQIRAFALLPWGERTIRIPFGLGERSDPGTNEKEKMNAALDRSPVKRNRQDWMIPAAVFLIVSAFCMRHITDTNMIYAAISSSDIERYNEDNIRYYTAEEVQQLKSSGNIVLWYENEDTPMIAIADSWSSEVPEYALSSMMAVRHEVVREALNLGWWSMLGVLAVMKFVRVNRL